MVGDDDMIQERYRKNQNDNDGITLNDALKGTAIAGLAGLTMAYQPFGRTATRFLGRVTDTVKKTFKSMESIRQGESLKYYTKSNYRQLYDNIKTNWASSRSTVNKLKLNTEHNGSLAAYIQATEAMVVGARQRAQDAWLQDYVRKDALEQLRQQGFDHNTATNLESFVAKAVRNAENFGRNMELARQHKLEGQALSFAEQISKDIQIRYDRAVKQKTGFDHDFIQKLTDTIEREFKMHAYNVGTMERALGSARLDKKDIATLGAEVLSLSHKMTWQEAKSLGSQLEDDKLLTGKTQKTVKQTMENIENFVRQYQGEDAYKRLLQITVDESNLFMSVTGEAFSKETSGQIWRNFLAFARNTLPGKLFRISDIDNALRTPAIQLISKRTQDPVLQAKLKQIGEEDKYHVRIGQDIFSVDLSAQVGKRMYRSSDLNNGDLKIVSGRYGFYHSQLEALSGKTKTHVSDNWFFRKLDIFQDREEYSGHMISNKISQLFGDNGRRKRFEEQLKMTPEYAERYRNAIVELNTFFHNANPDFRTDLSEETRSFISEYIETQKKISSIFRTNTYKPEAGAIDAILGSSELTDESRKLFELLRKDDASEILRAMLDRQGNYRLNIRPVTGSTTVDFLNNDLRILLQGVEENPEVAQQKISLVTDKLRLAYGTDFVNLFRTPMQNITYTFEDVLKREIAKEALLRQGLEPAPTVNLNLKYDKINALLEDIILTDRNRKETEKLAQFGIWQYHTAIDRRTKADNLMYLDYYERMMTTDELLRGTEDFSRKFQDTFKTTMADEISWLEGDIKSEAPGVEALEDYVFINRTASPLDIVHGINDIIFLRGTSRLKNEVMNVVRGLTAGRDDMAGANLYTFVPFFTLKRLSDELNRVGLGFSSESTKSTADLAMSFMMKRALPIAVGVTYLDFTDDISREVTGTGLWEGFTAGVANIDLAARKVISDIGADDWLKEAKSVNPIWQYWGGKDEYQGYEERQEYYRSGYTPVRKAAW